MCDHFEKPLDGPCPDAGKKEQDTVPGQFVGRVGYEPQVGDDIADVGHFIKFPAAEKFEANARL